MFDMGITEMLLIGIVALVVIGPERLPGVARTAGKYLGKLKRFMTSVKADVESELRTDELREILAQQQQELNSLKDVVTDAAKDLDISADVQGDTGSTSSENLYTPSADDYHSEAHSVEAPAADIAKPESIAKPKTKPATKPRAAKKVKPRAKAAPRAKAKTKPRKPAA